MKKLLGLLIVAVVATSAFAQGTVTMQNNNLGWITQWTSATDTATVHSPTGSGTVDLFAAPAGATINPLGVMTAAGFAPNYGTLEAFLAANTAAGWVQVGSSALTGPGLIHGGVLSITGVAAGANAAYILIGWNSASGTLDTALTPGSGGWVGESALLSTGTGGGGGGTQPPVNLNTTFNGLTMSPVVIPEPTSFALAGLGLAALLVFRRRN